MEMDERARTGPGNKQEGLSRNCPHSLLRGYSLIRLSKIFYESFLDLFPTSRIISIMRKIPQKALIPRLLWLAVFSIAMGLLEAIVVVYLRELYFPGGFRFPLQTIPERMLGMEILREICTLIMLVSAASVCARTFVLRFSLFLFMFGIVTSMLGLPTGNMLDSYFLIFGGS